MSWVAIPKPKHKHGARARKLRRLKSAAIWAGVLLAIGGLFYGLANTTNLAYTERHLPAVDFTSLNDAQRRAALTEANVGRCTCACGMTLAQCVATDMTCPVRTDNIAKIRAMVQKALSSGGS